MDIALWLVVGLAVIGVVGYAAYETGYYQGAQDKSKQMRGALQVLNGRAASNQ